jgi:hypothetical protein
MWEDLWVGVKWIAKACLVLAILAIVLLPFFAMPELADSTQTMSIPAGLSDAWVALVALAFSLFLLYLAWRVLRTLVLKPFGTWGVFGTSTSSRLMALGLTAILMPKAVEKIVLTPPTILFKLMDTLGRRATNLSGWAGGRSSDALVNIQAPLTQLAVVIPEILSEVARILTHAIDGILTADVVIAIALWCLAGSLLSAGTHDETRPSESRPSIPPTSRLSRYLHSMSAAQRHGLTLTAVFLIGAYLSIAAIVAIPWLHEEKVSPGLTQESLTKMLDSILPAPLPPETQEQGAPEAPDDPLAPLSEYAKTAGILPDIAPVLESTIRESRDVRARALLRLQQMPREINQRVNQMRQAALSAFELETATLMSNQERGYFMRQIQQSITADYRRLEATRAQCASSIADADRQLRDMGQVMMQVLESANTREQQLVIIRALKLKASDIDFALREACDTPDLQATAYTAPVAGTGWGPFGAVARWLLQTKSLPLALITGMLGFGLLGSAIATFVRGGTERGHVSLTAEVTSVVVRGLSAAVVVFLAVKGGLAVFSSSEAEPNAYVVFLTCLVGAVFSEDVWNWARTKFLSNFGQEADESARNKTMAETIEETLGGTSESPGATPSVQESPSAQASEGEQGKGDS